MSTFTIRPFRRRDREQLTRLVNRHAVAVMPGASVSVDTVLPQLERDPDEFIVDPWVRERHISAADRSGDVMTAAHVLRYRAEPHLGDTHRNAGEIRWLVCWPTAPEGDRSGTTATRPPTHSCTPASPSSTPGRSPTATLMAACPIPASRGSRPSGPTSNDSTNATASSPAPPRSSSWPISTASTSQASRRCPVSQYGGCSGSTAHARRPTSTGNRWPRSKPTSSSVPNGTCGGMADSGNLHVDDEYRRLGLATWMGRHAADWLRLGHADRLLAYASPSDAALLGFLCRQGFTKVTHTRRGWTRPTTKVEPAR